jgi:hypothetical protein
MRRGRSGLNGSLTIIVLTLLTTFRTGVRACVETGPQAYEFVGYFFIVITGPATGRRTRALSLRALLPCLALIAFDATRARAQTLTPDLFRPVQDGFIAPQDLPLRRTANATGNPIIDKTGDDANDARLRDKDVLAPSRIGQIPTYGLPAANGAAGSGFDSLNRTRKKPKLYPGQAKPKPSPGPGSPAPLLSATPTTVPRLSIPPSGSANKTPLPPAMAGTVVGHRRASA